MKNGIPTSPWTNNRSGLLRPNSYPTVTSPCSPDPVQSDVYVLVDSPPKAAPRLSPPPAYIERSAPPSRKCNTSSRRNEPASLVPPLSYECPLMTKFAKDTSRANDSVSPRKPNPTAGPVRNKSANVAPYPSRAYTTG